MEINPKLRTATDELAVLEFDIGALENNHGLPMDEADLAAKRQCALALYATIRELRNGDE